MIKILIRSRIQAFFSAVLKSGGNRQHPAILVLLGLLMLYAAGVVVAMMYMLFDALTIFFNLGIGWMYFAFAGSMALGLSVVGSVFTTQNQLYDARDNELLLSMPIPPTAILISRLMVLLMLNLFFVLLVMIPAEVVFILYSGFSVAQLISFLICCIGMVLFAQTLSCIFGWVLHQFLTRISNKAVASMLYVVLFFVIYIGIYSQANRIMGAIMTQGLAIADFVERKLGLLLMLGRACLGRPGSLAALSLSSAAIFSLVCWVLSRNFVRTVTAKRSGKRRIYKAVPMKVQNRQNALCKKELRRFLSSSVYLTNQGLGILMMPAAAIAAVIFRTQISDMLILFGDMIEEGMAAGIVIVCVGFLLSTSCISAPSVSLEGKNLWILRSMPVSGAEVLRAKLRFHIQMTTPVTGLSALIAGAAFGCTITELVILVIASAALTIICGITGLLCNLQFPRFDWINEAGPCKQSVTVMLTMIIMLTATAGPAVLYCMVYLEKVSAIVFLTGYAVLLVFACLILYRFLITWGAEKLEGFDV